MSGVAAVLGMVLLAGAGSPEDPAVREETVTLPSGGKEVKLQVFAPGGPEKCPAIVFLHGADGLKFEPWAQLYRLQARAYARQGFVVVFPHYMDRTGNGEINIGEILKNYTAWLGAIRDTVTYTAGHPRVDPARLAIMGVSLGGTLAIDTAATDRRIKALVDYFGGFPVPVASRIKSLPPTLILHGARDRIVSPKDAERLDQRLTELNVAHELKLYPDSGHGFLGADARDALERGVRFLRTHLPPSR